MKIVQVNSYDGSGGAARAALRLHHALKQQGIASQMVVNFKYGNDPEINSFSKSIILRLFTFFLIGLEQILVKLFVKPVKVPFSLPFFAKDIYHFPSVQKSDIVHLHWTNQGFLKPLSISRLMSLGKPVVWTFHDSYAFTGGCHVRYDCDHYKKECGNCPVLKKSHPNDLSNKFWHRKAYAYAGKDFVIITPSTWLAKAVKESSLLKDKRVEVIPNAIDTETFLPTAKIDAREKLGLPEDKILLLSGFMPSKVDLHKGTGYLLESLELLNQQINTDNIELIIFGNKPDIVHQKFPLKTTFLGKIDDDVKLALAYSAANAFLTTSIEDNLPNTVMESLSCGTPVVSFTTGGIPDMVDHQQNGYLAEYKNASDFTNGIRWIIESADQEQLSKNARQKVIDNYSFPVIAQKHIELYNSLV